MASCDFLFSLAPERAIISWQAMLAAAAMNAAITASYFQSLGIGHGDMVMLILKRRYEFWYSIIALHKLGAVVIPATHVLTKKDIEIGRAHV